MNTQADLRDMWVQFLATLIKLCCNLKKSLQIVNVGERVEKREHSYIVDGNVNLRTTVENSTEVP